VVFNHSPWHNGYVLVGARNAVQLFYIISGFLICHVLRSNPAYQDPLRFYFSRALRLYPLYYSVAALALIGAFFSAPEFFSLYRRLPWSADLLLVLSNLFLFGQDWVMFSAVVNGHLAFTSDFNATNPALYGGLLVPQAWTLGLELTFYAIAPFVLRSRRTIAILFVLSVTVRILLLASGLGTKDPWSYRFFPAELSLFLLGALSQHLLLPACRKWRLTSRPGTQRMATALMVLFSLVYFLIPVQEVYKAVLLFAVFVPLLPLTFLLQGGSPLDRKIGDLSYPIYIGHVLVIEMLVPLFSRAQVSDPLLISLGNVAAAVGFAVLLNRAVAEPIERLRQRVKSG